MMNGNRVSTGSPATQAQPAGRRKPRNDYQVSAEQFVQTWQECETAQEVAVKLGMPKAIVHARASSYRSDGIRLKKMRRESRRALDIEGLNRLVECVNRKMKKARPKKVAAKARKEDWPACFQAKTTGLDARRMVKKLIEEKD